MSDYIYENPPLVEVIAEIHWQLQPIVSIPGGGIDPHYTKCLDQLRLHSNFTDFKFEEKLIPDGMPIEFLPNQPAIRFRKKANTWPLYQLGSGIFVVNLTPPYEGWNEFKSVLKQGVEALLQSYPYSNETLKIHKVQLKYIDAFKKRNGFDEYLKFLSESLQVNISLPEQLLASSIDGEKTLIKANVQFEFPLKKLKNGTGAINIAHGKAHEETAVITSFEITGMGNELNTNINEILDWFDCAHIEVRSWFEIMASEDLKQTFGSVKEI